MSLIDAIDELEPGGVLVQEDVDWHGYDRLLAELEDRPAIRVTYVRGRLQIVNPAFLHAVHTRAFADIVDTVADSEGLDVEPLGSTTFKRRDLNCGVETDRCFYIANAARIIGSHELDLTTDPPPDLVVEIDVANSSLSKFAVYAALGVPEIWHCDGSHVEILVLAGGTYQRAPRSLALPTVEPALMERYLGLASTKGRTVARRALAHWLRERDSHGAQHSVEALDE